MGWTTCKIHDKDGKLVASDFSSVPAWALDGAIRDMPANRLLASNSRVKRTAI